MTARSAPMGPIISKLGNLAAGLAGLLPIARQTGLPAAAMERSEPSSARMRPVRVKPAIHLKL